MEIAEFVALLMAELKDDVVGTVRTEGNEIVVEFVHGTSRTIMVT